MAQKITRLKPSTYTGAKDPVVRENWIEEFNKLFETTD